MKYKLFLNQRTTLDRFGALTDGVYAIVLTLLVLDLKVPDAPGLSEAKIVEDLLRQLPNFLSYLISFFVVGTLWVRHHLIFKPLKQVNTVVLGLNFVHLLFVTVTPYTASLFGHYKDDPLVVFLFSGSIGMAALSLYVLHQYVVTYPDWFAEDTIEEWKHAQWILAYPVILVALLSMGLSFVSVTGAILVWVLFPLSFFLFLLFSK